jgi:hypothetical protein
VGVERRRVSLARTLTVMVAVGVRVWAFLIVAVVASSGGAHGGGDHTASCKFLPGTTCADKKQLDIAYVRNVTTQVACCEACRANPNCSLAQYIPGTDPNKHDCPQCCVLMSGCAALTSGADPLSRVMVLGAHQPPTPPRPAVLFATAANVGTGVPPWVGYVERAFVSGLMSKTKSDPGFEVDFLEKLNDLNSSRLSQYNVVVLFISPASLALLQQSSKEDIPSEMMLNATIQRFLPTILNFTNRGGGVFLFPSEQNWYVQFLPELMEAFGMVLPVEVLVEGDPANVAPMDHMSLVSLAYTRAVAAGHPATAGVKSVWYPTSPVFQAGYTGPLLPDPNWTVLLRGSPTMLTKAVNASDPGSDGKLPPCANSTCRGRTPGVAAPPLLAVRDFGKGRVGMLNQWRHFTTGSGSAWFFDEQVLLRGVGDRPSDMGRLLRNTLRWLATAPQASGGLGGFVTPPNRWQSPNDAPAVAAEYADVTTKHCGLGDHYDPNFLDGVSCLGCSASEKAGKLFRGLIGARTSLSDGSGSVQEYASAAKASKIDFIVFLETFALGGNRTLGVTALAQLKADCAKHSDSSVLLLPGYVIVQWRI